jgi:insulysin
MEKLKIHLQISGFNDKAPLLLQTIINQMSNLPLATKEQFDIYVARHEKMFANGSKHLPVSQAKDILESVLMTDRTSYSEKLSALQTISYDEFLQFSQKLLEKTYVEALFAGNLSPTDAQSSWIDVQHVFSKAAHPKARHVNPKVLALPSGQGPFALFRSTEAQGNGAILAIDEGSFSLEKKSAQEIFNVAVKEAFFNELRTKQKTGYIAKADSLEIEERLFHVFMVQSNSHQPEDLVYRFELFFEEYLQTLQTQIDPVRFDNLKATCIHSLQTRFRNLKDKAGLWNQLAFEKGGDFEYVNKRVAALEELSYENFLSFVESTLSRSNLKRLAVFVEGRLNTPFAYETIDTPKLLEISRYETKPMVDEGVVK